MRRYDSLRASDADRDAVMDRLRTAAGEGRLEPEELEERVLAALSARTYGELEPLLDDLPRDGGAAWPKSRGAALARFALVGAGLVTAITLAVVVIALVVLLVLAVAAVAAITWIACVVFWLALRRSRWRGPSGAARGRDVRGRHVGRPRATGFL
jgi:Domain of unknown function (DUF1707)